MEREGRPRAAVADAELGRSCLNIYQGREGGPAVAELSLCGTSSRRRKGGAQRVRSVHFHKPQWPGAGEGG